MDFDSEKIFSITLIVNILLHVTILFTILAIFFMFFIANISSDAINHELKHSIDDGFDHLKENKSIINKINNLKNEYTNLVSQYTNDELLKSETLNINSKLNDILLQINNLQFLDGSLNESLNGSLNESLNGSFNGLLNGSFNGSFNGSINGSLVIPNIDDISNWMKNLSFDYYLNLFSKNNTTREKLNNQIFSEIKMINFLLILFLIIFVGTLNFAGILSMNEFKYILLENTITFIFVGIVEIIFFLNIALKFIPVPPSLIFKSLIESLKKNLQKK